MNGVLRYSLGRAAQSIPLLLAVVCAAFALVKASPGDPVTALAGDFPISEEYRREVESRYGLDQPWPVQLLKYLGSVVRGDLGFSFMNNEDVSTLIWQRLGPTVLLTGGAMLLASIGGVVVGTLAARRPGGVVDVSSQLAAFAAYAMPVFWLGQLLIMLFAIKLGWLPAGGMRSLRDPKTGFEGVLQVGKHMILPAVVFAARYFAITMRVVRDGVIGGMDSDYSIAARARGVKERRILVSHALRNAMLPVVTILSLNLGFAMSGTVLIETVFNWPGLGRLLFDAIGSRDYPVVAGVFIVLTSAVVVINLIADILYGVLDPRVTE